MPLTQQSERIDTDLPDAAPEGAGLPDEAHRRSPGLSTIAVHSGAERNKLGAVFQRASYPLGDPDAVRRHVSGEAPLDEYCRYGSPNEREAEGKLAAIMGREDATLFNNGMKAITSLLFATLNQGDHVVVTDESYHRIQKFLRLHLSRFGIDTTVVRTGDYDALEAAITPQTKLLFTETPSNPQQSVVDVERFADIGRERGIATAVDATLATPYNLRPKGIDYEIHSVTKYLAGHNEVAAGVIGATREKLLKIIDWRNYDGGNAGSLTAAAVNRGLATFALRMPRHNENGLALARFLQDHPAISKVHYPGLEDHPHYEIAQRQMRTPEGSNGYGGMVTFEIAGAGRQEMDCFFRALRLPEYAASMGTPQSLVQQPYVLNKSHHLPFEMVRFSAGLEDSADILDDVDRALHAAKHG